MVLHTLTEPAARTDPRQAMPGTALVAVSQSALPQVAGRKAGRENMGLMAGAAGAVLLGAITLVTLSNGRNREAPRAPAQPRPAATQPLAQAPVTQSAPAIVPATAPAPVAVATPRPLPAAGGPVLLPTPSFERDRSPTLIVDAPAGVNAGAPQGPAAGAAIPPAERAMPAGLSPEETFGFRVGESSADTTSARRMADPSLTVSQGTLIAAVLETAIDSDLPGFVRAVVSQDVRGFDGTRVLIPRSSRLIGQYKSGVAAGQTRAYVVWSRLIRPDGVSVALASPAVDTAGRTGLPGEVDNHFFKRFGSSMLLSVIGAAGALRGGGVTIATGDSAAAVAAQRDGQRSPTIRVRQGQPIRIFTARDLNFASIEQGARS